MKVLRPYETETSLFEVGDVISFELADGEKVEAMAMKQEADGMIFMLVDCLKDEECMNEEDSNRGGYEASDLRVKLNGEILERFPAEIREQMVAFANGDMLRLPTEKEIFGVNEYGVDEGEDVQQFAPIKLRRNRIAFQGHNGGWEWYWLANKHKRSASYFAMSATPVMRTPTTLPTLAVSAPLSKSRICNLRPLVGRMNPRQGG